MRPPLPRDNEPARWIKPAQLTAFDASGTDAHRLASAGSGWVERLGSDVQISYKHPAALAELVQGLDEFSTATGRQPARVFGRLLPRKNEDRAAPVLLRGDAALPIETTVTEASVSYGVDFAAGYSHGLFLDQRANRAHLRNLAPKRLLNTFAYTCSFSVVAALTGAETLSVDLSKKSLDRGRANFSLNALQEDGHRFLADDVLEVLPRLARRGEKFDAIILDPPTFSRGNKGRRWQVEDHMEELINAALDLAAPRCAILISTNCTSLDAATLERMARFCAKVRRLGADCLRTQPPVDFPPGHGASTVWMNVRQ